MKSRARCDGADAGGLKAPQYHCLLFTNSRGKSAVAMMRACKNARTRPHALDFAATAKHPARKRGGERKRRDCLKQLRRDPQSVAATGAGPGLCSAHAARGSSPGRRRAAAADAAKRARGGTAEDGPRSGGDGGGARTAPRTPRPAWAAEGGGGPGDGPLQHAKGGNTDANAEAAASGGRRAPPPKQPRARGAAATTVAAATSGGRRAAWPDTPAQGLATCRNSPSGRSPQGLADKVVRR